jgi:hypothetical protein
VGKQGIMAAPNTHNKVVVLQTCQTNGRQAAFSYNPQIKTQSANFKEF